MDLHKAQIQGFFDIPVDHLFAAPVIIDHLRAYEDLDLRFPLPESERARDRCILLPLFHQMTDNDQWNVVSALMEALS
jgi:dTDP-4-amino-4,6-dideoxygalactose transaminase